MSARAFARVDGFGKPHGEFAGRPRYGTLREMILAGQQQTFGASSFKLNFTPV